MCEDSEQEQRKEQAMKQINQTSMCLTAILGEGFGFKESRRF